MKKGATDHGCDAWRYLLRGQGRRWFVGGVVALLERRTFATWDRASLGDVRRAIDREARQRGVSRTSTRATASSAPSGVALLNDVGTQSA